MVTKKEDLAFDISKFNNDDQSEIERIKTFLETAEVIKVVARQSKWMPRGKLITPKTIFATDKRIIMTQTCLGYVVISIQSQIVKLCAPTVMQKRREK